MCGLLALIDRRGVDPDLATRMRDSLRHRGPDDLGLATWRLEAGAVTPVAAAGHVMLGHTRLAILDLSSAGHQPMVDLRTGTTVVFNGEIYNYRALRNELAARGRAFSTATDTEVLLAGWEAWGEGLFPRLVGMFALALLDPHRRQLILARDFAGIKPLFVARRGTRLAVASEIKALLVDPDQERRADPQAVWHYLAAGLTDHADRTCFAGVEPFPPGSWAAVDLDHPTTWRPRAFWRPTPRRERHLSLDEAAAKVRSRFLASVRDHLASDVPVGAALSGGIDSSAIVCAMRAVDPKREVHTFTFCAEDPNLDEKPWADLVATQVGAHPHPVRISAEDIPAEIDAVIRQQDEPFGSTSILAQRLVFREARSAGIPVILDGQGADELLAGYRSFLPARVAEDLDDGHLLTAWHSARAARRLDASVAPWRGAVARLAAGSEILRQRRWIALAGRGVDAGWFAARNALQPPTFPAQGRLLERDLRRSFVHGLPQLLRTEDRNAMAFGVESRVPFLTPAFVDLLWSLPARLLIDDQAVTKAVFRRAMRGLVPDQILDRRDKIGFATPELAWFRRLDPWVHEVLGGAARSVPVLRPDGMLADWQAMRDGRRPFDWRIWRWINLIRWSELHGITW